MATLTPAKHAQNVLNHPNYKIRLGSKFDKGDKLSMESLKQRLEPIIAASEKLREKNEADIFATNVSKVLGIPKSELGGVLRRFHTGGPLDENMDEGGTTGNGRYNLPQFKADTSSLTPQFSNSLNLPGLQGTTSKGLPFSSRDFGIGSGPTETRDFSNLSPSSVAPKLDTTTLAPRSKGLTQAEPADYKSRVPWMGAASSIIGNLLTNNQIDLPTYNYKEFAPEKATANLVNYGRGREQTMNERDQANNIIAGSARNTGSANSLMENTLAGVTGTQRIAGDQFNKSLENEGNVNAQILNQTSQFNAAQTDRANQINNQNMLYKNQIDNQNMMINSERRDAKTSGILGAITGFGKDLMAAGQYDNMLKIATPDNYKFTNVNDSPLKKFLGITADAKRVLTGTNSMKRELGGFIIPKSKNVPISFRTK